MKRIAVVLADDHNLVRAGLRALLDAIDGLEVVGEAADGLEAVALAQRLRPDLVVMDVVMGGLDGLQATDRIRKALPGTRVIILSMHATGDFLERAIQAGASAYLLKDAAVTELELAVHAAMRGEMFLSPAVTRLLVEQTSRGPGERAAPEALTPRQREILALIGKGRNTKEIARQLNLSVKTVEAHRGQIMERLGVRDAANLVLEALRRGLISIEP